MTTREAISAFASLSAGTLSHMTGYKLYKDVDAFREKIFHRIEKADVSKCKTWIDLWKKFVKTEDIVNPTTFPIEELYKSDSSLYVCLSYNQKDIDWFKVHLFEDGKVLCKIFVGNDEYQTAYGKAGKKYSSLASLLNAIGNVYPRGIMGYRLFTSKYCYEGKYNHTGPKSKAV